MNALPSAGGVRRRPKKVPLSFSAEDRHSPPAGLPEGRRRQWCARRIDDERTWVKQRDTKGSWIVDRGSWIEDPKCPVLPGIMIPSETEISKNLEKEARNESWAEENKLELN